MTTWPASASTRTHAPAGKHDLGASATQDGRSALVICLSLGCKTCSDIYFYCTAGSSVRLFGLPISAMFLPERLLAWVGRDLWARTAAAAPVWLGSATCYVLLGKGKGKAGRQAMNGMSVGVVKGGKAAEAEGWMDGGMDSSIGAAFERG
ncbi:hypothetical protein BDV95DRAFT_62048 [Massariosphaeria phaeospora]|uniref:Uncharacterized protein n=1 Tax=Massariosphaeria phaeospora TaxID=100035 RepID=A0A7C8MAJ3_9PLEO|nr:hypothetical protein BDV95DRAFT_62048 [Massariosphaeria phaeospora]